MSSGRSPRKHAQREFARPCGRPVRLKATDRRKRPEKCRFHVYIGALLAAARRSDTDVVRNRRPSPSDWTVSRKTMECAGSAASRFVISGSEPPRKKVNSTPRGGTGT